MEEFIPKYDMSKTLHGEQYLELLAPLPVSGTVTTTAELVDIQDKGKGAVVVLRTITSDASTGQQLAVNEFSSFVLGTDRFQGAANPAPRAAAATAKNDPPARPADAVLEAPTTTDQAALYRLSGDYNPLHIDPGMSKRLGFDRPILHGLCSLGISARHVLRVFGGDDAAAVKSIKARFAKHVFPGETLEVHMWVTGPNTVVFQTCVKERGVVAISNAAVEFHPGKLTKAASKL
eukprot:jgi/Chrzof1/2616/Cz11g22170.t1_ECH2[v5.2]